jgi:hypothetical protein
MNNNKKISITGLNVHLILTEFIVDYIENKIMFFYIKKICQKWYLSFSSNNWIIKLYKLETVNYYWSGS